MVSDAPYDEIADWYEHEFLAFQRAMADVDEYADRIGVDESLANLLGPGRGHCLEIGCGTGIYADRIRALGWDPVGVDLSTGMLRHTRGRLPAARADATRLPVAPGSVPAVVSVMAHTDMPDYRAVLAEARRVLRPDGVFVHVGVHPCFCGGFADASDREALIIRPGYLDSSWTTDSWTSAGLRDKVGANHWPLASLLTMLLEAGFRLEGFREGGAPTPIVLGVRATVR